MSAASGRASVVFLLDVDNTLLDNDRVTADLREHLTARGRRASAQQRYWAIFEELRTELGYADYLGALQRYRVENPRDPHLLASVVVPGRLSVRERGSTRARSTSLAHLRRGARR